MTFSKDQVVSEEAASLIDQGGRKMVALYVYTLLCSLPRNHKKSE